MDYQLNLQDARYEGEKLGRAKAQENEIKKMTKSLKENGMSKLTAWNVIETAHKDDMPESKLKAIFTENFK